MNPILVNLFKSRWEQVKKIKEIELQQTSPQEKFCHLTQILRFGGELGFDWQNDKEDEELNEVRTRWIRLKGVENGCPK